MEFSGLSLDNPEVWLPITQQPYFFEGSRLLTEFSIGRGWRDGVGPAGYRNESEGRRERAAVAGGTTAKAASRRHLGR
jgi:hypothetical protein